MYSCPSCGSDDVHGRSRCACGADLSLLQRLDAIADAWFNAGLEALRQGLPGQALEWFSACCAARPSDAAARRAQAKVWAQLGRLPEAQDALQRARNMDPNHPDLLVLEHAISDMQKNQTLSQSSPSNATGTTQGTNNDKVK